MRVRSLLFENLSWKLLSLTLALLIWSGARLFMHEDVRPLGNPLGGLPIHDLEDIPVRILSRTAVTYPVHLEPASVFIRVAGDPTVISRLTERDAIAFVEVPSVPASGPTTNRVEARVPSQVRVLSIIPGTVIVTPGKTMTNSN